MLQEKKKNHRFHGLIKAVCIMMTALIIVLSTGCDLLDFFTGGDDGDDGGGTQDVIIISPEAAQVEVGKSIALMAVSSEGLEISWVAEDEEIAEVSEEGIVTGVKEGETTIIAQSSKAFAMCDLTVLPASKEETETPTAPGGYKLVWSDEFEGTSLNMANWNYQTGIQDNYYGNLGPEYWGNGELQYYTNGQNVKVQDGALQIIAKRENRGDRPFTSARITTRDLHTFKYGKIEAKMKTPAIQGMWPAFWMLPNPTNHSSSNNIYGGWPANGELDIMEAKGRLKSVIDTTLHFGGPDWYIHDMDGKSTEYPSGYWTTEDWHTYAVEWTAQYIAWLIDGREVYRSNCSRYWSSASSAPSAPFDQPFYIILNLAVGGMYDGYKEPPADFTQATMYVDYVRVYQKK